MKYALLLCSSLLSLTALAQKVDLSNLNAKDVLKDALKSPTIEELSEPIKKSPYSYQNGKIRAAAEINTRRPYCRISKADPTKKIKFADLQLFYSPLIYSMTGESRITDVSKSLEGSCWEISEEMDLAQVFGYKFSDPKDVIVKDVNKEVKLVGLTDEEKPEALINVNGVEELALCDDIMFKNAKNGLIETDIPAFASDLGEIVNVQAVGKKYARIESKNVKRDTLLSDLYSLTKAAPNEEVFITLENGKRVRAILKGEIFSVQRRFIVEHDGETLRVERVIRIIKD